MKILAEEAGKEALGSFGSFLLGVDSVAHGTVGYASELIDHAYRRGYVVDVVEGVEDAHHIEAVFDGFLIKAAEHFVGVGYITKQVAASGEGREQTFALHSLGGNAQPLPRRFVEITHHGIGHGTTPDLHDIESGVLIEGKQTVDGGLVKAGSEERLLTISQCQVADLKLACWHKM